VKRWLALVLVALLAACGSSASHTSAPAPTTGATNPSSPTTGASCNRPHAAGQSAQSFTFDGHKRTYQLYVPAAYDGTRAIPVVFDFHGFGSNAVQQMAYGNFKPEADRDDFLIVAPDGQGGAGGQHFNLTGEAGSQNDLTMVTALLDHIEAMLCVDTKRVFSTGMSDGGAMTSVLACTANNRFAAFGAVAVIIYVPTCKLGRTIPITAFSGTADPVVPFNGGKVKCCGGSTVGAAPIAMANWAKADGCDPKYTDTTLSSEVVERAWNGCRAGGEVAFYMIQGGGHTWPGAIPIPRLGKTTTQIDASATIWKFFQSHPLP
jgi:polyhydroxybutyrate depolymerase